MSPKNLSALSRIDFYGSEVSLKYEISFDSLLSKCVLIKEINNPQLRDFIYIFFTLALTVFIRCGKEGTTTTNGKKGYSV